VERIDDQARQVRRQGIEDWAEHGDVQTIAMRSLDRRDPDRFPRQADATHPV
jgi:hypothetical protein